MRKMMIATLLATSAAVAPVQAQDDNLTRRVDKLEREVRAVQRKVFPGGSGQTIEPEIGTAAPAAPTVGSPATAPLADLTARVNALESQLATLTGESERNSHKLQQLEEAFAKLKSETDGRLKALEGGTVEAPPVASTRPAPAPTPAAGSAAKPPATPAPSAERKAAVAEIQKPSTGDAGEDEYTYGFRLWDAKFYPEAQAQLKTMIGKHGSHRRISFARNLLGRAYLDDGKPALAATQFYENYQKDPRGERAADSLYYLGVSLTRLKKLADACKVYDEFNDVYGATASATLKGQVAKGRTEAKCKAG